jgi:hypothetical protein
LLAERRASTDPRSSRVEVERPSAAGSRDRETDCEPPLAARHDAPSLPALAVHIRATRLALRRAHPGRTSLPFCVSRACRALFGSLRLAPKAPRAPRRPASRRSRRCAPRTEGPFRRYPRAVRSLSSLLATSVFVAACGARTGMLDDRLSDADVGAGSDGGVSSNGDLPACKNLQGLPGITQVCIASRALFACLSDAGTTFCQGKDVAICGAGADSGACVAQCRTDEYGLLCFGPEPPGPPPGCRFGGSATDSEASESYCCSCG